MRVLIVTPYFSPRAGGVENYVLAIALGLQKIGWEVFVVSSGDSKEVLKETVQNLTVFRLPIQFKLSNTPVNTAWKNQIVDVLKEVKPDLVNVHTPVPFLSDIGVRAAAELGIPSIVTYHNDIFKENSILNLVSQLYYHFLGDESLAKAKKIITTSSLYAEKSAHLQIHTKKIAVIPPGVYENKLLHQDVYKKPYVLFVGTLDKTHRHKGVDFLLEAFKEVQKQASEVQLMIVGRGDDLAHYQELAREYGIQDKVTFRNDVSNEELPQIYAGAFCLCLPSVSVAEGFGMVVIEAAQQKTPSIGSDIGGISQSIQDKKTGLLFLPKNASAIAEKILLLYSDRKLRNELGEQAYNRVRKDFTWPAQVEKTNQLFKSVIQ